VVVVAATLMGTTLSISRKPQRYQSAISPGGCALRDVSPGEEGPRLGRLEEKAK
jgi:hypothetical protein